MWCIQVVFAIILSEKIYYIKFHDLLLECDYFPINSSLLSCFYCAGKNLRLQEGGDFQCENGAGGYMCLQALSPLKS